MPFSFHKLVLLLRSRSGKTRTMIIETFEDGVPGVRDKGRWRKATRNFHKDQFKRHCKRQRFY